VRNALDRRPREEDVKMQEENQRAELQEVLDELLSQQLTPFKLTAYKIQANGRGEYRVAFNDSRIRTCRFSWKEGENFKEAFRVALLERVDRMSGPLCKTISRTR
jgi:hypothetical protein